MQTGLFNAVSTVLSSHTFPDLILQKTYFTQAKITVIKIDCW